jgi:glycine cleavage system H lipoate-binding protein
MMKEKFPETDNKRASQEILVGKESHLHTPERGESSKGFDPSRMIGIDQPFDYDEVVRVTGSAYAQNLDLDGFAFRKYEEVKNRAAGFHLVENQCIWMKAGIVNFRECDNAYDCADCSFDKSMREAMKSERDPKRSPQATRWLETLGGTYSTANETCIHFLAGNVEAPENCEHGFRCDGCPVHQEMSTKTVRNGRENAPHLRVVSGYLLADDYHYHFGHTWVNIEHGSRVRVGVDDFLGRVFGRIDRVKLPPVGASLKQGEVGWVLVRKGQDAPVRSPISGEVLAANPEILREPELMNREPFQNGWLFLLEPRHLKEEMNTLYHGRECLQWVENEHQRLLSMLGPEYGRLAATGGQMLRDFHGRFPKIPWSTLVSTFLHTVKK